VPAREPFPPHELREGHTHRLVPLAAPRPEPRGAAAESGGGRCVHPPSPPRTRRA